MHLQKSVVSCGAVFPRLPRARTPCVCSIRTALRSYLGKRSAGWLRQLDLRDVHFRGRLAAKHVDLELDFEALGVDALHKAHKAFQGAGSDLHGVDVELPTVMTLWTILFSILISTVMRIVLPKASHSATDSCGS